MTSERGAVQCVMALVLLLLVPGQTADLKWSVRGKSEFNTRLRAFPHLESLPKVNAQVIVGSVGVVLTGFFGLKFRAGNRTLQIDRNWWYLC